MANDEHPTKNQRKMMTTEIAKAFATQWLHAWNSHDIHAILEHYADDIEFYSPFIPLLEFNEDGIIRNKTDLKRYFEIGLSTFPDLHFQFHHVFVGIHSVVIYYTSVNGRLAAEVFELNNENKATRVLCHYFTPE